MFTRTLAIRLLAPTVLVSLALVGSCIFGALFLNQLHVNLSKELSENIESTRSAKELETTTDDLLRRFREGVGSTDIAEIDRLNDQAEKHLADAIRLANLEQEKKLVPQIETGLRKYMSGWKRRKQLAGGDLTKFDKDLAIQLDEEVLDPSKQLHKYNLDQIEESNLHNQKIIRYLTWGLLAVGIGAPVSGLLLGYAMARRLHYSIYQLSVGIRDAAGRLNRELGSVTLQEEGDLPDLHRQLQGVIAEIERVVEQLQQREREVLRAEQLAAVGQVAAGVAHELRNPLTSVKMLVQTGLEGDRGTGLPAEDLEIIEHEVRRMETCIQMFLDFARPSQAERRQADLCAVLRRALALIEGRARRQKVTMTAQLPSEPINLSIDPEQIHQVLVNLLLNAVDALPRGGNVTVSASQQLANGDGTGRWVEVCVRDTGPGIAARIRERLFEPFVSSKETGVGLGLSICKRLIEAHGGTIQGENGQDGGALFTFRLPR